jgi:lysophospholipase L1-like esterase
MSWTKLITSSGGGTVDTTGLTTEKTSFNLYDKSRLVSGSYHEPTTGVITSGAYETHKINVKPGYTYTFNRGDAIGSGYSFYDSSNVYISGGTALSAKAPVNANYMYVKILNTTISDKLMVIEGMYRFNSATNYIPYSQRYINSLLPQGWFKSKWYGKTWWVLGDSISTGYGDGEGVSNAYASNPYHYLIAIDRFINVQNDAVSGYKIADIYNNRVVNMPPSAYAPDLITIMAGTNDHGFNNPIGLLTDDPATSTNFIPVYRKTIEWLQAQYPYATIGLITPIRRYNASGTNGDYTNALGKTVKDYCDAVKSIGAYYDLPVLDIFGNLGFTPYNATQRTNFYVSGDGTHPNNLGHKPMAAKVGNFIESI